MSRNIKLAIDSSQKLVSCAIAIDDKIVAEETIEKSLENYIILIDKTLKSANVDIKEVTDIYVCVGPGSQMGIRNGIVTGNSLALALNIKVYGVLSIDAASVLTDKNVVCVPAGRTNYYVREYNRENNNINPISDLKLIEEEPEDYSYVFENVTCARGVLDVAINHKNLLIENENNEVRQYE